MADLAQRQAQQSALLAANAQAAANQAAQGVSGQGKSQEQYQQEKAQAYAGALQSSGVSSPIAAPGNVPAAKSLNSGGGVNYNTNLFDTVGVKEGGGAGLFGPSAPPPAAKKVSLSDTAGIAEAIASERTAIRQAQIQNIRPPAPQLLISGENTNPQIRRNPNGFADYFGAAPAPQVKGQAKSVNLFDNVGVSANKPSTQGSSVSPSVSGIPLFSGGQKQGAGFVDVSSLDKDTVNKVDNIISSLPPGTDTVKVNINGNEKTYPVQSALGGIIADLNSARKQNPNADISYGIFGTGSVTTTTRPPKAETMASREALKSNIIAAGGSPINIFSDTGAKIGTTQGQRSTYDILKASEKGPISYGFTKTTTSETQEPRYTPENATALKNLPFDTGTKAAIGGFLGSAAAVGTLPLIGFPKPGGGYFTQSEIGKGIEKTYGENYFSTLLSGEKSNLTPEEQKGSLLGSGLFFGVGALGGLGGSKGAKTVNPITNKNVNIIAREGLREGRAEYQVSPIGSQIYRGEIQTPKGVAKSPILEFAQGTVAKSGNVSPEIKPAPSFLTREGPIGKGTVSTVQPKIPSHIEEIFGIGAKGEKVPTGIGKAKLPSEAGEAQTTISQAFLSPTKVSAVRPATGIPENNILAKNISPQQANLWGLKKGPGLNTYSGKVTEKNRELIQQAIKNNEIIKPLQVFEYPPSDYLKNPSLYGERTRNPKGLASDMFSGKITGPSITGYFEGGYTGSKAVKPSIGGKPSPKPARPWIGNEFGLGGKQQKGGAGASGKAQALTQEERENTMRNYYGLKPTESKQIPTNYLGQTAIAPAYQKGKGETTNIIAYPPGTQERFRQPKPNESRSTSSTFNQFFGEGLLSGNKQQTKQKTIPATDIFQLSKINERQTQRYQNFLSFGQTQPVKGKQTTTTVTRQNQETIPRQTTKPKQTTNTITGYITGQITKTKIPVPFEGGGNIPKIPKGPPAGGLGGFFFPGYAGQRQRSLPPGKRTYILYSTNPNQVGEFYTKGLPEQSVSTSPSIFAKGDVAIAKANHGRSTNPFGFTGGPAPKKSKSRKSSSMFF